MLGMTGKWSTGFLEHDMNVMCDIIRKTDSIDHHHPEGVVYRSFCLDSGTVTVPNITSRSWCIEFIFPIIANMDLMLIQILRILVVILNTTNNSSIATCDVTARAQSQPAR